MCAVSGEIWIDIVAKFDDDLIYCVLANEDRFKLPYSERKFIHFSINYGDAFFYFLHI